MSTVDGSIHVELRYGQWAVMRRAAWYKASALEIYDDIRWLYNELEHASGGAVKQSAPMSLILGPGGKWCLYRVSQFNISVRDMLAKSFPRLEVNPGAETRALPKGACRHCGSSAREMRRPNHCANCAAEV